MRRVLMPALLLGSVIVASGASALLPAINNSCDNRICVQKCCPDGKVLSNYACIDYQGKEFVPRFRDLDENDVQPPDFVVVNGLLTCTLPAILAPPKRFHMLTDGTLYEPHTGDQYTRGEYCLDYMEEKRDDVAIVCRRGESDAIIVKKKIHTAGLMISCLFLALTIALHLAIPSLRDMQSLCFICYMIALLVADAAFFTNAIADNMSKGHCVANAFVIQYSFLATFFWLNVMCFDIWRVIKATVNLIRLNGILADDAKKFKLYCLYAWGLPLVLVVVTAVMQFLPDHLVAEGVIRPGMGEIECWFRGDSARLAYFYGVVGVLFLLNLLLLSHTVAMLVRAGGACNCCTREDATLTAVNRGHLDAFWQRFSLFSVMAFCWMTEILSWKIHPKEIWIATDIINSLQGFVVFVIFVSSKKKREVLSVLWKDTKSSVTHAARQISRTEVTGVLWYTNEETLPIKNMSPSSK